MNKEISVIFIAIFLLILCQPFASAYSITDQYVGADDHSHGDVIGLKDYFEIFSAEVNLVGTFLTVDIFTNFAGKGDDGLFSSLTPDPHPGIGYGDLFLSSNWNPHAESGFPEPAYMKDDNTNGTLWTYGFNIDNRWSPDGGTGKLYKLNGDTNDSNALLSQDFITGGTFRTGQEVAVDTGASSVADTGITGSWSIVAGSKISFHFDISGTELLFGSDIALHWAETCANDTIEGAARVPEPSTMLLLGSGLIGLVGFGRKRFFIC